MDSILHGFVKLGCWLVPSYSLICRIVSSKYSGGWIAPEILGFLILPKFRECHPPKFLEHVIGDSVLEIIASGWCRR